MITDYGVLGLLGQMNLTPPPDGLAILADTVSSDLPAGSAEKLDFLGMPGSFREWKGARIERQIAQYLFNVTLRKYENSLNIPLDWIVNDKTGQVNERIAELSSRYWDWRASLVAGLINAGGGTTQGACFDGKALWADDHVWGESGTIDNSLTYNAAGSAPTANEVAEALTQNLAQLTGFLDDAAQPVNENVAEVAVVCGTAIGAPLRTALSAKNLDTGTGTRDNPLAGWDIKIRAVASPRITLANGLAVFVTKYRTARKARPLVHIENTKERAPRILGAGSDREVTHDSWLVADKAVGAPAYGRFWETCYTLFN